MSTTQNTPAPYTPTPWAIDPSKFGRKFGNDIPFCSRNNKYENPVWVGRVYDGSGLNGPNPTADANAHLITASVNSYAKHCGPNAIQCAEDDLLGQALEKLEEAERVIRWAVQESRGRVKSEMVDGWKYHAEQVKDFLDRLPQ